MNNTLRIRHDLLPGDLGLVAQFHGAIYGTQFGYNLLFEAYVAESLAEFGKQFDPARDRLWIAELNGRIVGRVGLLQREDNQSQLRWLLVDERARTQGLGRELIEHCVSFAGEAGYREIFRWTVDTLDAAAALYHRAGFVRTQELPPTSIWGPVLSEERYDLAL